MANIKSKTCSLLLLAIFGVLGYASSKSAPCDLRQEKYGGVCVCTADYCDFLDDPTPKDEREFVVVTSSKAGLRFETLTGKFNVFKKYFVVDYDQKLPTAAQNQLPIKQKEKVINTRYVRVDVNREKHHQNITGFGGSHTGAVTYLLDFMPQALQDHIYESYYAEHGIGFNLMRIPIGGCDFDLEPWAYNQYPENDLKLTNFTLDPRDEMRIKQIKRLKEVTKVKNLRIKGAAWSSPTWMKTNEKWSGRSRLKKQYFQTWADYHYKWLELFEDNGLPIWAISTGNEPMNGVLFMIFVKFLSLGWTPKQQAVWLAENLGPTLRNSKFKDVLIFGSDDQRYLLPTWFAEMNSSRPESLNFVDGIAVHWYWDEIFRPSFVDTILERMPEKILLVTESCIGDKPWQKAAPLLGSWERGEKFARSFLQNLQHGVHGWIDWNIVLDERGGPNYVKNFVDAPIIVNMTNTNEVFKQPMFYAMGHFSKFAPENSIRIEATRSNINIDTIAFLRPDGTVSVVLFNSANVLVEVAVMDSVRGSIVVKVPARSINTLIYH